VGLRMVNGKSVRVLPLSSSQFDVLVTAKGLG
jgi:hypothetical protein